MMGEVWRTEQFGLSLLEEDRKNLLTDIESDYEDTRLVIMLIKHIINDLNEEEYDEILKLSK